MGDTSLGQLMLFYVMLKESIASYYVVGVSLTHGGAGNQYHIWTFAARLSEVTTSYPTSCCPCETEHPILSLHLLEMRAAFTLYGILVCTLLQ